MFIVSTVNDSSSSCGLRLPLRFSYPSTILKMFPSVSGYLPGDENDPKDHDKGQNLCLRLSRNKDQTLRVFT